MPHLRGGILVYLSHDAVEEAFVQPFPGLGAAAVGAGVAVTLQGGGANAGMMGGVISAI